MSICFAPIGLHIVAAAPAVLSAAAAAAVAGDGDPEQNCFVCPLLQLRRCLQLRWNGGRVSPVYVNAENG